MKTQLCQISDITQSATYQEALISNFLQIIIQMKSHSTHLDAIDRENTNLRNVCSIPLRKVPILKNTVSVA
jgi:hypothetical protein